MKLIEAIKLWFDWKKRVNDVPVIDWVRGCGYYLPGQFHGYSKDIGRIEIHDLNSGKRGVFRLLNVLTYMDPYDMIRESHWQLIKYEGKKEFSKMTFKEYKEARTERPALAPNKPEAGSSGSGE